MSLTALHLTGYLRAEFAKSGRLRIWLFFIQLAAALPGGISVLVPDSHEITLYALSALSVVLLVAWTIINELYTKAKSSANAARRAALLLGGLGERLSLGETHSLRNRFTVTKERARSLEKADYYATALEPGPGRLAEMIEESALYSRRLQEISSHTMFFIILLYAIVSLSIGLIYLPFIDSSHGMTLARIVMSLMIFVMSSDVLGAWRLHSGAAAEIREICNRLRVNETQRNMSDVLLAFADYNAAVESAPESVPFAYRFIKRNLEDEWMILQEDKKSVSDNSEKKL